MCYIDKRAMTREVKNFIFFLCCIPDFLRRRAFCNSLNPLNGSVGYPRRYPNTIYGWG